MDHFSYKKNELHAEEIPLSKIIKEVGTPFYCYSTATLERHFKVFRDSFSPLKPTICYAVKANSNISVIKTLANMGAGADVVSEGEIRRAIAAGVPENKIIFSGVGKTKEEIAFGIKEKIFQFNVESEPELYAVDEVARSFGVKAPVAIRVNPDVDAKTHKKITTGRKKDKFGIDISKAKAVYEKAKKLKGIKIQGISTHIGSQITTIKPFREAFTRVTNFYNTLNSEGYKLTTLDLGGGLGIPYGDETPPTPAEYGKMVKEVVGKTECQLFFEPGRVIVGNAGIMVSKIIYVKDTGKKVFYILDAGMNDLIRPSYYDAFHEIVPVKKKASKKIRADIAGPVCETGDIFAKDRLIEKLNEGDAIAFRTCGAYGSAMASNYNSRPLIPEVLVKGDEFSITRPRQNFVELLADEKLAKWQD